ncbi:serine hydrolase domain-containing protein [Flexivirga caeni]|uniref:Beta-lactamase n=1 Tax=Flexivirga caeni TaxID=2294115 RepID=A0A3M9M7W3_9MICO|nr:serine hydrolase domain-containing protein [Flexivirga caeni]RNI21660.1 class A beta-lactamase-related serine hydrolase [Flexivirga caeni]
MIGAAFGVVVGVATLGWAVRRVVGLLCNLLHRPEAATGDPILAALLDEHTSRHTRRLGVAVVESAADTPVGVATVAATPESVFEIGSISKALTGMLIADAAQRGELDLADRVATHLPELARRPVGDCTIGELGSHTSGLPRLALGPRALLQVFGLVVVGLNPYAGQGVSFVIRGAARARLRTRGRKAYSNLGAALAGAVLERATGSSYPDLVRDRIVNPLGLTHTSADHRAPRATGHTKAGEWARPWRMTGYAPAGGVTSSLADLATVARALLAGTAPGIGSLDRDDCFWVRERGAAGGPVVWHNGETGGYAAYLGLRPEAGRAVIVLADVADMSLIMRLTQAIGAPAR